MLQVLLRWRYTFKLMMSGFLYGAFAVLLLLLLLIANVENWSLGKADLPTIHAIMLFGLPVYAILLCANMLAEDLEERTFGLLLSYRLRPLLLLLDRLLIVLLLMVLAVGLCLAAANFFLFELRLRDVGVLSARVLPVMLLLGMFSLLLTLVGGNMLLGLGAGLGYALFELMTMGNWTKSLFLYQSVFLNQQVEPANNQIYITAIGAALLVLCTCIFVQGRRWRRHL